MIVSKKRILKRKPEPKGPFHYLNGNWKIGLAIDLHTISSIPLGNGYFDTEYTELGKYLNEIKYHNDYENLEELSEKIAEYMKTNLKAFDYLDAIIPIPPSNKREKQPVYEIIRCVKKKLDKDIDLDTEYLLKEKTGISLKNIENQQEREKVIKDTIKIKDKRYRGKRVLLFDDLYRSGTTLKEATKILLESGEVKDVYVLTITKTRSKR